MNGIMVTLLTFMMTGIVVGQQDSSFGGQKSFGPRQTTNSQASSIPTAAQPKSNSSLAQIDPNLVRPMELTVDQKAVQGLKNGGYMRSPIQGEDQISGEKRGAEYISEISLTTPANEFKQLQVRQVWGAPRKLEDEPGEVLLVTLSDVDLLALDEKKLSLQIDPANRGRFSKVYFRYEQPTQVATRPAPRNTTGFQSNTNTRPTGQPVPLVQNPGPDPEPGDRDYMGPSLPQFATGQQNNPAAWNQQANQGNQTNPAFDLNRNIGPTRGNQFGAGGNQNGFVNPDETELERFDREQRELNQQKNNDLQATLNAQRIARLKREQQEAWDKEEAERRQIRFAKWQQEEYDRKLAEQAAKQNTNQWNPRATDNPSQMGSIANVPRTYQERQEHWDGDQKLRLENEWLAKERVRSEQLLADKEAKIRYLESLRTQRPSDYVSTRDPITPQNYNQPSGQTSPGPVRGTIHYPNRVTGPIVQGQTPERYASLGTGIPNTINNGVDSIRLAREKLTASIPGSLRMTNGQTKTGLEGVDGQGDKVLVVDDKRSERLIYFLLLCSLGLNAYLGLISRSFYVRYNELADELRETFTVTG